MVLLYPPLILGSYVVVNLTDARQWGTPQWRAPSARLRDVNARLPASASLSHYRDRVTDADQL
jgi:hypothetical protein